MAFSVQRPLQSAMQSRGKGVDLAPPAVAPVSPPRIFHSCCSYRCLSLAGCHAFLPWGSGELLHSCNHNLVHFPLPFSPLSTTHITHKLYFLFRWHPCLSPAVPLSVVHLVFPWAQRLLENSSAALFLILQPTFSVWCSEKGTTLTACNGTPKYQCGDTEMACTINA